MDRHELESRSVLERVLGVAYDEYPVAGPGGGAASAAGPGAALVTLRLDESSGRLMVGGETKALREELKNLGGSWLGFKKECGQEWSLPRHQRPGVEALIEKREQQLREKQKIVMRRPRLDSVRSNVAQLIGNTTCTLLPKENEAREAALHIAILCDPLAGAHQVLVPSCSASQPCSAVFSLALSYHFLHAPFLRTLAVVPQRELAQGARLWLLLRLCGLEEVRLRESPPAGFGAAGMAQ